MKNKIQTIKLAVAALSVLTAMAALTGCGSTQTESAEASAKPAAEAAAAEEKEPEPDSASGVHHTEIVVKDYGTILVELDADTAPVTVENFVNLANEGFYDGLTFHRIMDGFMIQGGDPAQGGGSQTAETIVGEFPDNGYENDISHTEGVISMARAMDPDSASSQFFITVADSTFLDGQYAAFGHVTEGLDIAKQIAKDAEPIDENGTIPYEAQPVIEHIRITD